MGRKSKIVYDTPPMIEAGDLTWSVEMVADIFCNLSANDQARFLNRVSEQMWKWYREEREFHLISIGVLMWKHASRICEALGVYSGSRSIREAENDPAYIHFSNGWRKNNQKPLE